MKKLTILLFSILISFNSYGETRYSYYDNGQKEYEKNYIDGKLDGKWTWWKENGKKRKLKITKMEKLLGEDFWKGIL